MVYEWEGLPALHSKEDNTLENTVPGGHNEAAWDIRRGAQ
jgi:hypothetical protein